MTSFFKAIKTRNEEAVCKASKSETNLPRVRISPAWVRVGLRKEFRLIQLQELREDSIFSNNQKKIQFLNIFNRTSTNSQAVCKRRKNMLAMVLLTHTSSTPRAELTKLDTMDRK